MKKMSLENVNAMSGWNMVAPSKISRHGLPTDKLSQTSFKLQSTFTSAGEARVESMEPAFSITKQKRL